MISPTSPAGPDDATLLDLHREHVTLLGTRYAEVLARLGLDAVIVHAGTLALRSAFDDQYWPLRVTPHFAHWLPLAQPGCALVVRAGARPRLLWPRDSSFWENPPLPERDHWRAALDVVELPSLEAVRAELPAGRVGFVGEAAQGRAWGLAEEALNARPLLDELDQVRVHKTPYEVACLAEANRRAALGHRAVAEAFRAGDRSELELHLLYLGATGQDDPETPYKNIVALGRNAATLHHIDYRRRPAAGRDAESLLLDAGAAFLGYASDITRTHVKPRGEAAGVFARLVGGMEDLQQALCAHAAVGRPYEELHEEAHRRVAELLREAGVARISVEEATTSEVTRTFFPHGLGHSLGLQTHDVGCARVRPGPRNPFLRNTTPITPGQVFTIEPGLYFIPALLDTLRASPQSGAVDWRLVEELRPLGGIRIEDDLLVRQGGPARNLTREVLPA